MDVPALLQTGLGHQKAGRLDEAERHYRAALAAAPDDPGALQCLGFLLRARGDNAGSLAQFDHAIMQAPGYAPLHVGRAEALRRLGRLGEAVAAARAALSIDPDVHGAHIVLSHAMMPGPGYQAVLERLHRALRPATYVEIGVATGASFRLAQPPTVALGIDPAPCINVALTGSHRVYEETSDVFFAARDVAAELGGRTVDFAFVDGLHTFDQALRDFLNIERHARPDTVVAFHDWLPLDARTAARTRSTAFWTGDTWKLVPLLRKHRPDLSVAVIPTAPSGLGLVTRLDPASSALAGERFDRAVAEFMHASPADTPAGIAPPALVANDWTAIERHLATARPAWSRGATAP